jgi:hypothetical protein
MNETLIITIILAFIGYIATYINNALMEKRKQNLELINKRINNFYGPLYVAVEVGRASIKAFFASINKKIDIDNDLPMQEPFSDKEEAEYRIWLENVFMPLNEWCEIVMRENAYLIIEEGMPPCILEYFSHVYTYKAIIGKWKKNDFTEIYSAIPYPKELYKYATESYNDLKKEQLNLIKKSL